LKSSEKYPQQSGMGRRGAVVALLGRGLLRFHNSTRWRRLSSLVTKAAIPAFMSPKKKSCFGPISVKKYDKHEYLLTTLLTIMLPLKRGFVDISSTGESDKFTNVAPDLNRRESSARFTPPNRIAVSALICLGMVSERLGSLSSPRAPLYHMLPGSPVPLDKLTILQLPAVEIRLLTTSLSLSEITHAATRSFDNSNYHFVLQREDGAGYLACSPGNLVASLNTPFSQATNQILLEIPSVDFDFYVTRQSWSKVFRSQTTAEKNPILNARVNVSANASMLIDVGRLLSAKRLYLQRPACQVPGQIYQNPHYVKFPGIEPRTLEERKAEARSDIDSIAETDAQKEIDKDDLKNEFAVVFGSLIRSHCLSEFAADRRIRTSLTPYVHYPLRNPLPATRLTGQKGTKKEV
jgi:hypothetical protein